MNFNTLNPELDVNKIQLTDHAYERARERLGKNKQEALGLLRNKLRKAKRIGLVKSEDGNESVVYAIDNLAIHLSPDLKTIITIIRHKKITYKPLKSKLIEMHEKEMRKLDREEKAAKRKLKEIILDFDIERANLKRRMYHTRSEAVKLACEARLKAIDKTISEMNNEIKEIQSKKRKLASSMVVAVS